MSMLYRKKYYRASVLAVLLYTMPFFAHAATLSFVTTPAESVVNQQMRVSVHLNTGTDSINAVEGLIMLPASVQLSQLNTGGSGFSLWPTEPQFSFSTHRIVFAGGVPGGVVPKQDILLFTFSLTASSTGAYTVSSQDVAVYRNDGLGTRLVVPNHSQDIKVGRTNGTVSSAASPDAIPDTTPPHFVSVAMGSDPSLFGGKFYISFFATDNQSGIDHYDIKEGWSTKYLLADRYFVLHDQTLQSIIYVRATDAAGNSVVTVIPATHEPSRLWVVGGGILFVVLLVWVVAQHRQKKKKY